MELYPDRRHRVLGDERQTDRAVLHRRAGRALPSFSLLDPNYDTQSQENPQNIVVGEAFVSQVVQALGSSPPAAHAADPHLRRARRLLRPRTAAGGARARTRSRRWCSQASRPTTASRYGSGCPPCSSVRTSSATTSAMWSTTTPRSSPSSSANGTCRRMTYRDANANDLTDFLDLTRWRGAAHVSPSCPRWPRPATRRPRSRAATPGPGMLRRSPRSTSKTSARPNRSLRGLLVELEVDRGTLRGLDVELYRRRRLRRPPVRRRRRGPHEPGVVLRDHGRAPRRGRYTLLVRQGARTVARRPITIG